MAVCAINFPSSTSREGWCLSSTLVVDPGHGGKDAGAQTGELIEQDVNLDSVKRTRNVLERAGFEVVFTRQPVSGTTF